MNKFLLLLWVGLALLLPACTTMTPNECKAANWYDVGLRDGLAGAGLSTLNDRTKDCAEARVQPDTVAYLRGRDQGLLSYCRIDNAVRLGLDGKSYGGVCPIGLDAEFRRRYNLGREVHSAHNQLSSEEARRQALEKRLREAASDDDRRKIRDELVEQDYRLRRARDRVRDAEIALDRLR
jgi:Protein of unknown function (DUF2799)